MCPSVVGTSLYWRGKQGTDGYPWYSEVEGNAIHLLSRAFLYDI